jgi:uncharacterized protein YbjT (DUF2867 family)
MKIIITGASGGFGRQVTQLVLEKVSAPGDTWLGHCMLTDVDVRYRSAGAWGA